MMSERERPASTGAREWSEAQSAELGRRSEKVAKSFLLFFFFFFFLFFFFFRRGPMEI